MEIEEGEVGVEKREIAGLEEIKEEDHSGMGKREGIVGEGGSGLIGDHKRVQKMRGEQERESEEKEREGTRVSAMERNMERKREEENEKDDWENADVAFSNQREERGKRGKEEGNEKRGAARRGSEEGGHGA